jgi:hypothetical protein
MAHVQTVVFDVTSTARSICTLQNAETFMAKATGEYSNRHAMARHGTQQRTWARRLSQIFSKLQIVLAKRCRLLSC